jgi:uncharacterized protein YkwD
MAVRFVDSAYRRLLLLHSVPLWPALLLCGALAGCGDNPHDDNGVTERTSAVSANTLSATPGAPAVTGNVAQDGYNWINFRRVQAGLAPVQRNSTLDVAAASHSTYLKDNDAVSHDEIAGRSGYTGITIQDRLKAAGYRLQAPYAVGEVIAATGDGNGAVMTEQLITAIYHRFVILQPVFTEVGTGAAAAGPTTWLSADFAASGGLGPGLGAGGLAGYPYDGQQAVPTTFYSDAEAPDPVPGQNAVGYPVSVQADITRTVHVQSFTLRPRGGAALAVRLLSAPDDAETPASAAAIVPLTLLAARTTYEVQFSGDVDGAPASMTWTFTTQ